MCAPLLIPPMAISGGGETRDPLTFLRLQNSYVWSDSLFHVRSTLSSFQFLRSQIRTTLIKAKEGERTDSGKVSDYREAAQLAESFFCTPAWEAKHKDGVINQVVVFASDAKDMVERPTVEPTYSTLVGQKKSYSYLPSSPRKRR